LLYWIFGALMVLVKPKRGIRSIAALGLLLAVSGAYFYETGVASKSVHIAGLIPTDAAQAFVCLGFSLTLPFLASPTVDRSLANLARPAAAMSAFSYSLYLIHYPINSALDLMFAKNAAINLTSLETLIARLSICIAAAVIFYFLFERRTAGLRRWMSARLSHGPGTHETVNTGRATP
jgi:peptidoglycan/LPS O-acetylase OafA/YrhL